MKNTFPVYNSYSQHNDCTIKEKIKCDVEEYGIEHISNKELIMFLLDSKRNSSALENLSEKVLGIINSSEEINLFENLLKISEISISKASLIVAALELGRRRYSYEGVPISSAKDILPFVQYYTLQHQEHFLCISLNGANEIIKIRVVSIGTINRTLVHPREIFAKPLKEHCASVILCHNHPSGNINPSKDDIETTHRLEKAGEILGIKVLDHIIITKHDYYSFLEQGLLCTSQKDRVQ